MQEAYLNQIVEFVALFFKGCDAHFSRRVQDIERE